MMFLISHFSIDTLLKPSLVESLYIMSCDGQVIEHQLEPRLGPVPSNSSGVDDAPLELHTPPLAQWNLQRYAMYDIIIMAVIQCLVTCHWVLLNVK